MSIQRSGVAGRWPLTVAAIAPESGGVADERRKQFRAVATRVDTLAVRYQAMVCVADIFIWLRARPDRSPSNPRTTP